MSEANVLLANVAIARESAIESAKLLKRREESEEELERLRSQKVKINIKEQKEKDRIERISEAIETGTHAATRAPKSNGEIALSKELLMKLFEERCDAFARYYFSPRPKENYDGIIKSQNSELHWWLYERLHYVVTKQGGSKTAVAAPRGSAKSMVTSVIFVLWCVCFRKKRHIIIISDTDSQAQKFLLTIKNELENNQKLIEDFPEACGKTRDWRVDDIVTKNDIKLDTFGMGGAIRGTTFKSIRPDLVIMDDIENDEHVLTKEQRTKAQDYLEKKILKLGNKDTDYFFIGTILHYDSLLAKVLKNPSWYSKKFKAVIHWSQSPLWEEWEEIYTDRLNENREKASRKFFEEHQEEMLKGTKVLWPENESYLELMEMRCSEGSKSFNSEKQNEPVDVENATFREEDIVYFDERNLKGTYLITVGAVDPSLGSNEKSNLSAIVTVAKDREGYLYVLDADIKRRTPDDIIKDIILYHKKRDYQMFAVESVAFQEFFKTELVKRSRQAGVYLPTKGVKTRKNKGLRIESLQPLVKDGIIRFKKNQTTLIEQLIHFPLAESDDGPDALALALTLVRKQFRMITW